MSKSSLSTAIRLAAAALEIGRPESPLEIGSPDFTELHHIFRAFPKNEAERHCYRFLLEQMRAAPDRHAMTKDELEKICRRRFRVTVESFDYCWREAIKASGARWNKQGRPSH